MVVFLVFGGIAVRQFMGQSETVCDRVSSEIEKHPRWPVAVLDSSTNGSVVFVLAPDSLLVGSEGDSGDGGTLWTLFRRESVSEFVFGATSESLNSGPGVFKMDFVLANPLLSAERLRRSCEPFDKNEDVQLVDASTISVPFDFWNSRFPPTGQTIGTDVVRSSN